MKKLTRILMMMLVLSVGTGITSCDEIEDMIDNPVVPEPTPTPTPQPEPQPQPEPTPQPTPEEIENQRIAEAKALLEESRQEGSITTVYYTVNGVEQTATFKRVGKTYVLQYPILTRGDGFGDDNLRPYLMDLDSDEELDDDDEDDDDDVEPEVTCENLDGTGDDDDVEDEPDDGIEIDPSTLKWKYDEESWVDDEEDDDDDSAAGTRAMMTRTFVVADPVPSKTTLFGLREMTTSNDPLQTTISYNTASYSNSNSTENNKTSVEYNGNLLVNSKTVGLTNSESSGSSSAKPKKSVGIEKITNVVFKSGNRLTLINAKKYKIQALIFPNNATIKQVTWRSSDVDVATVSDAVVSGASSSCWVTVNNQAKKNSFTITFTARGKNYITATCMVRVVDATLTKVEIRYNNTKVESLTFTEGDQPKQLKATVTPSNANPNVTWKSSNTAVATVDKNGNVTPKGVGTATITCISVANSSIKATCTVTVKAAPAPEPEPEPEPVPGPVPEPEPVPTEDPNSTLAKPDNFNSGDSPF